MPRPALYLSFLFLYPWTLNAAEEDSEQTWLKQLIHNSIIKVGIGFRSDELKVIDERSGGEGTLISDHGLQPVVALGFENAYFGESRWGYSALLGYTRFSMDEQKIGNDQIDLGTSADGELIFLAPSIFYTFGAQHYEGSYLKLGLALGLGYLRTDGDILLTNRSGSPRHSFDIKSKPLSASAGFFMEAGYRDWFLRFQAAGPIVEEDDREISGTSIGLSLGYTFHLFH